MDLRYKKTIGATIEVTIRAYHTRTHTHKQSFKPLTFKLTPAASTMVKINSQADESDSYRQTISLRLMSPPTHLSLTLHRSLFPSVPVCPYVL